MPLPEDRRRTISWHLS